MSAISPPDTVPAAAAASATRRSVSPVPSLTRLSPSRIVTTRRGRETRRAMLATATASVGDRMAPRAKAMARGKPGTNAVATAPTTTEETTTSPTARAKIGRRNRRKSTYDPESASPKTRGARMSRNTSPASSGADGPKGRRPMTTPATTTGIATPHPRQRANPATAMATRRPAKSPSLRSITRRGYRATSANSSGDGHAHTRLRSPYAPSTRRTGGQYLVETCTPGG